MMKVTTTIFFLTVTTNVWADANAVKQKASSCFACHGANGISPNPIWPNIGGQKEQYLIKQLKAFKDGTRVDPMMTPQAKMLDENDVRDLAHYFAELKASP